MSKRDLLLEIGCEELPASYVLPALEEMEGVAARQFKEARLSFQNINLYGTPRRLTLLVDGLDEMQEDLEEEIKGPPLSAAFNGGQPTSAARGFAGSQGVEIDDLMTRETEKGEYVFARRVEKGEETVDLLPSLLRKVISSISFPRSMRWGQEEVPFGRPIRWLLSLYGEEVVPFRHSGLKSGRKSHGLRFFHPQPIEIKRPSEYLQALNEVEVIADYSERKSLILEQLRDISQEYQADFDFDSELVEEVTNLVEYPTAFVGEYDRDYLELPQEVLVNAMQEHQRYFPLKDSDGKLMPYFVGVRNGGQKSLDKVIRGNEQVLEARLADARFFYQEDQKESMEDRVEKLKRVLFHEDLGSIYEKTERVSRLAERLAAEMDLPLAVRERIVESSHLMKADLTTEMVDEFPKLQGVIGREYALLEGKGKDVALPIEEHYFPRFAGDLLPTTREGSILSLADKLDSITSCFGVGLIPSGSQDPYALRRQGQGIIRITLEQNLNYSLQKLLELALDLLVEQNHLQEEREKTAQLILDFFRDRMQRHLSRDGFDYDLIASVLQLDFHDLTTIYARLEVLQELRNMDRLSPLVVTFNRVHRLADKLEREADPEQDLFSQPEEEELWQLINQLSSQVEVLVEERNYREAVAALEELIEPTSIFFDRVMVMVDDQRLRENRLALLQSLSHLFYHLGDLTRVVIEDKNQEGA